MSLCSPALTTLPWLPRRKIVDALLDDLGFAKVVVLRAVCGKPVGESENDRIDH